MKTRRFRVLAAALALLFLVLPAWGGDREEQVAMLRRRMEESFLVHAQALIDEQSTMEGKADVALILGAFVETGMVGEPDLVKAIRYYEMAADMGSGDADCVLGNLYYGGAETASGSVERDFGRAIAFYLKAAAKDSVAAMLKLGDIYADGMGVDADPKKALVHYMNAAERGDEQALDRLRPVMEKAKEWEESHPGKKANFPTDRERVAKPELVRALRDRYARLEKLRSKTYIELNRRLAASIEKE